MTRMPSPIVSAEELDRFMETEFAQVFIDGRIYTITDLGPGTLTMRLDPGERHLRPGGTVSGPTLFTLADYAAYCVILAHIGLKGLSVTTSFHINFMRKAEPGPVFCTARLLKLGKRLVVVEISIADEKDDLIAHGSCTYSIPPRD
ncbi:PaaI family thioesterase [Oricola nitratireducens]|uniref:PaaI family thioesterase n=1 Tax=Oricola nitratireducens TaxID=2775868 RepID=UPI001FEDB7AB|nr:PaaI family thioesterase [Oricola nitratireducens]